MRLLSPERRGSNDHEEQILIQVSKRRCEVDESSISPFSSLGNPNKI